MVSEMRFQCSLFLAKLLTVWVPLPLMVRSWKASELCGENDLNRGQTKKLFKTFFVPSESDPTWCDVREIRTLVMSGKDPQCCEVREIRHVLTSEKDPPWCDVREIRPAAWHVVASEIRHVVTSGRDPQLWRQRFDMFCRQRKIRHVTSG